MKSLLFILIFLCSYQIASARNAIISSIDDDDYPENYVEVSEEALPLDLYRELINKAKLFQFTPITETRAGNLFATLKSDPRARMRFPDGLCTRRRIHIQSVLRGQGIKSGKLFINCPARNGRLRLRDQVSGRFFTFSNFHDTNVVLIGNSFHIMDLQYQSGPMALSTYLAQIETFQRLQPAKRKDLDAGVCFWKISSPAGLESPDDVMAELSPDNAGSLSGF